MTIFEVTSRNIQYFETYRAVTVLLFLPLVFLIIIMNN
jgi:hypothetical protein